MFCLMLSHLLDNKISLRTMTKTDVCHQNRVGKFMRQYQKPWINLGFMMLSCHKSVYDIIVL